MGRRLKLGLLAVFALISIAIASSVAGSRDWMGATPTPPSGSSTAPVPSNDGSTEQTSAPQGDPPEPNTGPLAIPGEAKLAGPPLRTARRFVAAWLDRGRNPAALRAQRAVLVGLSTGNFAQLLQVTIADALATGEFGPTSEGSIEFAKPEETDAAQASVLVLCRERPQGSEDFIYTVYIAKLVAVAPGRFAMSDLEPQ